MTVERCEAVYPPSTVPKLEPEGPGWDGPVRCVLTAGHEGDWHWCSGLKWSDER